MKTLCILLIFVAAVYAYDCTPGETYKVDCNNCHCGEKGKLACTKKSCPPNTDLEHCTPGALGQVVGCNQCICVDGIFGCTQKKCDPEPELIANPECTPGIATFKDCNSCACSDEGRLTCTEIDCSKHE